MINLLTEKELHKCAKDPIYFIINYCQIIDPIKGLVPLLLHDYQEDVIKQYIAYRFNIVLKARQLGISTITVAYALWLMLFHGEKNIRIITANQITATNIIKRLKRMFYNLPDWMRQIVEVKIDNRKEFSFDNDSQIKVDRASTCDGCGESLSLLIIDEAAYIERMEDIWTGILPTLIGGACIVISTLSEPDWFYEQYERAEQDLNDFNPIKLMWDVHPEHDGEWFETETKHLSKLQIAKEFLCDLDSISKSDNEKKK